jgi:hypothetical protein
VRQLLWGCARPLVALLSEDFQAAVQDSQSRQQRVMLGGKVRP